MSTWDRIAESGRLPADQADALNAQLIRERDGLVEDAADCAAEVARLNVRIAELEAQLPGEVLKPGLRGLVTTNPDYLSRIPYAEFGSVKLRWNAIETAPGVYDFSAIDAMFAAHPDIRFRVRFMAGIHSPDWVKVRSGGAVQHNASVSTGGSGMVPRFWTEPYLIDYMAFMAKVAARYEAHPQFVEVPNSLTTTVYAEPFILAADAATIDRYWAAGYRRPLVEANLRESIAAMMDLFPTTRVSLAGHGKWEYIVPGPGGGSFAASWEDERAVLNDLSATYGARLVLDDHGLGADDAIGVPQPRETATSWYNYMAGLETTEQTYGWQFTPKDLSMTVAADMGVQMGACFEEFAAFEAIPEPKRRQVHDALLANAAEKP